MELLQPIGAALLIAIPIMIWRRFQRDAAACFLNIALYPLLFSFFYLLLPAVVPRETPLSVSSALMTDSSRQVDHISIWSTLIFCFSYLAAPDHRRTANPQLTIPRHTRALATVISALISLLMIAVLAINGLTLLRQAADRGAAYRTYEGLADTFRLPLLFSFALFASVILYLHSKRLRSYSALIPFCIMDGLTGGRGYIFASALTCFLTYITFYPQRAKKACVYLAAGLLALTLSTFVRRYAFDSNIDPVFSLLGEFYGTHIISEFALQYFQNSSDLLTYFALCISKLLPQFLVRPLFSHDDLVNYATFLNTQTGVDYGLAGSLLAEAAYYGGSGYAYVAPILVGATYVTMNRANISSRIPGYLFFLFLSAATYNIFRSSFFFIWSNLIYLQIFYFSPLMLGSLKQRVFVPRRPSHQSLTGGEASL